jgi:hypothetical protein
MINNPKNNFQSGVMKIENPLKNRKFVSNFKYSKSPISNQQKGNFNSEQKPITRTNFQSNFSNSKSNTVKWQPKKFVSSYQNSKLGSKLQSKIMVNNSEPTSSNNNVKQFVNRIQPSGKKYFKNYKVFNKNNLIKVSQGKDSSSNSNINVHAFKSVRNPKSFSSSFQINREITTFNKNSQGNSPKKLNKEPHNIKRKFFSSTNQDQTLNKLNFMKKAPAKSFIKFLQPRIIRKDFNKNQSFKSNRVLSNMSKTNGTMNETDIGKGAQYRTNAT